MMERRQAFEILAGCVTDELVVTGIGAQSAYWCQVKHRPGNLYLRGPMGLAAAVSLGVALARPERRVVGMEGDGGLLMGLGTLVSIAHSRPPNLTLVCFDNGIYESGGRGATLNAGRTDFAALARSLGIPGVFTADTPRALKSAYEEAASSGECAFIWAKIAPCPDPMPRFPFLIYEVKYQFRQSLKD